MFEIPTLRRLSVAVAGMTAAAATYAFVVEPRWLDVTRPHVALSRMPSSFSGLRIALLTDLHVGRGTTLGLVRRACRAVMREAPDLIAVTGDLVDQDGRRYETVVRELNRLEAPLGVCAVPGNREHALGLERWRRAIRAAPGIVDLTDRSRVLHVRGGRLAVVGVDDPSGPVPRRDVAPVDPAPDLVIALSHRPSQVYGLQQRFGRVDLLLAGHTHGGQVRLPGLGALIDPWWPGDASRRGVQQMAGVPVYVSRGVGTAHLPVRLFCRPEVAVLELG